jgi:AAA domain (dynein-related subfamily)
MTHTELHHIVFTKDAQRMLNEKALSNNTSHILGVNNKSMAARGWTITTAIARSKESARNWDYYPILDSDTPNAYRYGLHFTACYTGPTEPNKTELRAIVKTMNTRASHPLGGRWSISTVDDKEHVVSDDGERVTTKDFVAYTDVDIPEDFEDNFSHLYGLDSHVGRVRAALEAAIMSQFSNRYHVALIGPPGCGKSDICASLKRAIGDDAVMEFDATATTAAGAIKELDDREILPRILLVEEIEKADEKTMSFLLGLMDMRAEIRKTTARATIQKDTKLLVIATVNNHDLFEKLQAGALSSRFSNRVWFKRPSEELLRRILAREIAKVDGDDEWIEPVITYAREKNIDDPRMIAALCLCGRDGWLDGTFVKMLGDTDKPQDY